MSLKPLSTIAWQSGSNRRTSSVMLSSTRKIARAPWRRASRDVGHDAVDAVRMEVPAAHLDDRAEAAVERAAARRLDDVDLPAEERVAAQHARRTVWKPQWLRGQPGNRPFGVVR